MIFSSNVSSNLLKSNELHSSLEYFLENILHGNSLKEKMALYQPQTRLFTRLPTGVIVLENKMFYLTERKRNDTADG